jgi:hypothetical protein
MALTANRDVDRYVDQELRSLPVKGGAHIFKGGFVGLSGGHARALTAGDPFAGIAYEEADNSAGGDGAVMVRVFTTGDFEHALTSASRTNNRAAVFASDDGTLTTTAAGNSFVGHQIDVTSANRIVLRIQTTPTPLAGGTMTSELVSAGLRHAFVTKDATGGNVSLAASELGGVVAVNNGTSARSVQLPAVTAGDVGKWVTLIKVAGATGAITVLPEASGTIDGGASNAEMDAIYDSMTLVCVGAKAWSVVSKRIA